MAMKLDETKVVLALKHAPEKLKSYVEHARNETAREWVDSDGERAEIIQQVLENDVYELEQIGWEIMHDPHLDEYTMAVVTPVPDWHEGDLDENTRRFIYEWKEATMDAIDRVRADTGLRPRLFVAALLSQDDDFDLDTEQSEAVATALSYSEVGLRRLIENVEEEIEKAAKLCDLTGSPL